jgi:hypothetical protein
MPFFPRVPHSMVSNKTNGERRFSVGFMGVALMDMWEGDPFLNLIFLVYFSCYFIPMKPITLDFFLDFFKNVLHEFKKQ